MVLSFTALPVSPRLPRGVDDVFLPAGSIADGGIGFTYAAGLLGLVAAVGALG